MTGEPTMTGAAVPPASPQGSEPSNVVELAELVVEDRFSMVPEWVLDADIGDCALRLYAARLHKKSGQPLTR